MRDRDVTLQGLLKKNKLFYRGKILFCLFELSFIMNVKLISQYIAVPVAIYRLYSGINIVF